MDTKVRKLIICHRRQYPKIDIEHFFIKWGNGRRGLSQQELTYEINTIGLKKYLDTITNWLLQLVNIHEKKKKKYTLSKESYKFANQLDHILKEIGIKDKAIYAAKTLKKRNKNTWN